MKDKLVLADGTVIELESSSSLFNFQVLFQTKQEMVTIWDKFIPRNLTEVVLKDSKGVVMARYENLVFINESSTIKEDGTILTSFNLREKTETELLKEELSLLKAGQEIQDGAIEDLGTAVSDIAGGIQ